MVALKNQYCYLFISIHILINSTIFFIGRHGGTWNHDKRFRRPLLYPTELRTYYLRSLFRRFIIIMLTKIIFINFFISIHVSIRLSPYFNDMVPVNEFESLWYFYRGIFLPLYVTIAVYKYIRCSLEYVFTVSLYKWLR